MWRSYLLKVGLGVVLSFSLIFPNYAAVAYVQKANVTTGNLIKVRW
ncbi:MAG: hypothetical protein ACRCXC_12260 [Legionella sp.]